MKVKLINQARRRVVIPEPELHTVAAVEAFKAGVRALAYELEKDTTPDYTGDLLDEISKSAGAIPSPMEVRVLEKNLRHVAAARTGPESFKAAYRPEPHQFPGEAKAHTAAMLAVFKSKLTPGNVMPCMHQTLPQQLSDLIAKVFDNEEAFLAEFFPEGIAVDEFYMASERCRVVLQKRQRPINPKLLNIDYPAATTIKTADFLAWVEGLDHDQN